MGRTHPWAELRGRAHIRLGFNSLAGLNGLYVRRADRAAIVLDESLTRRERRAVLAHELVHDERGGGCVAQDMPATWDAVVVRDELIVQREVAQWLVPPDDLVAFIEKTTSVGGGIGVTVWEVAEEFDVPEDVALSALRMLASRPAGWSSV